MPALEVKNVSKIFKTKKGEIVNALNEVSLKVEPGEIHGLLGPNGAGKSTLINLISGVLRPTAGDILVHDLSVLSQTEEVKKLLGVVPQEIVIEMAFTVEEVLYYFSGMYGVPHRGRKEKIDKVLADLHLSEKKKDRARNLSGGMKRRLMIAKAILHEPKILILDEPTAGVDVALRQKIWELVRELNNKGTTILFTTHYLEEAEQLCDNITLINHGQIVKEGKLKDILQEYSTNAIHFELHDRNVPHLPGVKNLGTIWELASKNLGEDLGLLLKHYDGNIKSIRNESVSLEQVFLQLTNN
ncbi:MAG TPA: ABC transporter ATP-binding protein [Patescibacteria group bacterium]|nr:ABC transporter ATP-binding protein [Patescibacteria group bacterium]